MSMKNRQNRILMVILSLSLGSGMMLTSCGNSHSSNQVSTDDSSSGTNDDVFKDVVFEDATFEYDGKSHEILVRHLPDGVYVTYQGNGMVDVGTYEVLASLKTDPDVGVFKKEIKATMTIVKRKIRVPSLSQSTFHYDGTEKQIEVIGFDDSLMSMEGTSEATQRGDYQVTITLKDTKNNEWDDPFFGILTWSIMENEDYVDVVFYDEDNTTVLASYYVEKGTQLSEWIPEPPEKPGYYSFWDCAGILVYSDTEVHVIYELIDYRITYELDGGEYDGPNTYTVEDEDILLGTPTKLYCDFLGWYTDPLYQNVITKIPHGSTGDIVVYAKFESNLSITYYDGTTQISTVPLDYGSSFTLPDSYEKDGLPLVAWIIDGTYYTPNKSYTCLFRENVRADALFSEVNTNVNISPDLEGDSAVIIGLANQDTTDLVISEFVQAFDGRYYQATSIGSSAFRCSSLVSVQMPESITSIKTSAFTESIALTQIQLSSQITEIETATFEGCTSLAQIDLPSGVTDIDTSAFQRCTKLENITLPSELKRIGSNAFFGSGLKTLTIPDGVTTISDTAFGHCLQLSSLTLPKTVETIGYGCFAESTSLTEITYLGTMAQWNSITLNSGWNGSIQTIHCMDGDITLS